jgi:hypothetical protein
VSLKLQPPGDGGTDIGEGQPLSPVEVLAYDRQLLRLPSQTVLEEIPDHSRGFLVDVDAVANKG